MENKSSENEINEIIKNSVIARIDAQVPSNLKLAMGSYGGMGKEEMIEHVRKGDDIGRQIVKKHIQFLKAVASGELTKALISVA